MKKIIFLTLLGLIGLFLSEFLIWNVSGVTTLFLNKGILSVLITLVFGVFIYIVLFSLGADIIHRLKIKDWISLVLLGSIYGLILEGVFADLIFRMGIGPDILGLSFSRIAFPTVSWHAIIDFSLGIMIFSYILKGKILLKSDKINLKETFFILLFCFFWFIWSYSGVILNKLPQGIPIIIQSLVLLIPITILGVFLKLALSIKKYIPNKILGTSGYIFCIFFIGFFALKRYFALDNKLLFLSFLTLILFYLILFFLHLKFGRKKSEGSIFEEAFLVKGKFKSKKYCIICLIIIINYILFKVIVNIFNLNVLLYLLTTGFFVLGMIFAIFFPFYVIINMFLFNKRI